MHNTKITMIKLTNSAMMKPAGLFVSMCQKWLVGWARFNVPLDTV